MNAKVFFETSSHLDMQIDAKLEELERTKALALRITQVYSAEPRGGAQMDKMAEAVAKIEELEDVINLEAVRLLERRSMMRRVIEALPDACHQDVLTWRYKNRWSWARISEALGCKRMQAWSIHDRALEEAQVILDGMGAYPLDEAVIQEAPM